MKYIPYAIIAAMVVVSFLWYGNAQYEKGVTQCQKKQAEEAIKEKDKASKEKVKNDQIYQTKPISDIDRIGASRGWVRNAEDR